MLLLEGSGWLQSAKPEKWLVLKVSTFDSLGFLNFQWQLLSLAVLNFNIKDRGCGQSTDQVELKARVCPERFWRSIWTLEVNWVEDLRQKNSWQCLSALNFTKEIREDGAMIGRFCHAMLWCLKVLYCKASACTSKPPAFSVLRLCNCSTKARPYQYKQSCAWSPSTSWQWVTWAWQDFEPYNLVGLNRDCRLLWRR